MDRIVEKVASLVPAAPKRLRVAAYARVSSNKDAMLHSLSEQANYYSRLIQNRRDWIFCGVYLDEAITGTKADRPSFQKMLEDCREKKLDMIITKSISRFARNTVTMLDTTRELKSLGIDVFFEEQNLHSNSNIGELMLTIVSGIAQEEARSVSENMKWRYHHGFEMGKLLGLRYLFGYYISKDKIEINEEEAKIVREIFDRVIEGESFGSIARDMENRKIKRRFGGRWSELAVHEMVANEKYTGNALLQKTFINNYIEKRKVKNNGLIRQYYVENSHPAIVDMNVFKQAGLVLENWKNERKRWSGIEHTIFSSRIFCADCGNSYMRITVNGIKYYQCTTYMKKGKAFCAAQRIPEEILYSISTKVLGLKSFSEDEFLNQVSLIFIMPNKCIKFLMNDGTAIEKHWSFSSRSNSWTPQMKEKARERAMKRRMKDE